MPSDAIRSAKRINDPPGYPTPSERSAKSARVVPAVVVAIMTAQYRNGWKDLAAICAATAIAKMPINIALLSAYPQFSVIETASPPVSPKVVAAILISQKATVTSGTLRRPFSYFIDYLSKASAPMRSENSSRCKVKRTYHHLAIQHGVRK